jgi:hypothetical protein
VQIAVPAGRYAIHASRAGKMFAGQVTVAVGGRRVVRGDELSQAAAATTTSKGGRANVPAGSLAVAFGGHTGIADHLGMVPAVRAELASPAGLSLAVDVGSRSGAGFRETSMLLLAGYRRDIVRGAWSAWLGLEIGGGAVAQSEIHPLAYSGIVATGGVAGLTLDVARHVSLGVETTLLAELLKRDGKKALVPATGVWFAVVFRR